MKPHWIKLLQLVIILMFVSACADSSRGQYHYMIPKELNDGIKTAHLNQVGLDSITIAKGINRIHRQKFGEIHSLLIYKNDRLVLEAYFKGHDYQWDAPGHYGPMVEWNADLPHSIHSVSKSMTSLCVGIAIEKGFIKSVKQSIFDYLPNYQHFNTDNKEYITIEHLLTCTSGLQWAEWSAPLSSRENDQIAIWFHEKGPIDFVLQRPFVAPPGQHFNYSGGGIELLGVIIENASGMSLQAFSDQYLFQPLGMSSAEWAIVYPSGEVHAAAGLKMTPRDMLKVGAMLLHNGVWNGTRVISEKWVKHCQTTYPVNQNIKIPGEDIGKMGYAYTWWTKTLTVNGVTLHWYSANGWGGQKIIVLPELDMVITLTGANYNSKVKQYRLIEDIIFTALK